MITTSILIAILTAITIFTIQLHYFLDTGKQRKKYKEFFNKANGKEYEVSMQGMDKDLFPQLTHVGIENSDLNSLIKEINSYLFKTKGTSDYEFIHNKVERKLKMRHDQSVVYLAFPTYIGLMGTFGGVFLGILAFLLGFDDTNSISDDSIKNLLIGVLVSMSTSLLGLILTTINNAKEGEAQKKIEDDKNVFYDFIQTEVTKTASASLVFAISRLHDTVDKFEPAFNNVIENFQNTFNTCTRAFGDNFEKNVMAVANAVDVMGRNMDKINENIALQEQVLYTIKSGELVQGISEFVDATKHFNRITLSLKRFEETRSMMLEATQEAINLQNQYSESLKIPREVAIRVNQILDRIKDFEKAVNEAGRALQKRDILGNDVITAIESQLKGISKKGKIADKYLELADGRLEKLFETQTKALSEMNTRYKDAIEGHISGFEKMIVEHTKEMEQLHSEFIGHLQDKFSLEEIRSEFSNLKKLNDILKEIRAIAKDTVKAEELTKELQSVADGISKNRNNGIGSIFGGGNSAEIQRLRSDNGRLQREMETLREQVTSLKKANASVTEQATSPNQIQSQQEEPQKKKGWFGWPK